LALPDQKFIDAFDEADRIAQRARRIHQKLRQSRFSFFDEQSSEILAIKLQQIESVKLRGGRSASMSFVQGYDLTVNDRVLQAELGDRIWLCLGSFWFHDKIRDSFPPRRPRPR
jgi:hypothetical protein